MAITGRSGCGKTTLINLLLGTYAPLEGHIKADDLPLAQIGIDRWRQGVATVMQDDTLFAGSISDNICFFDERPDFERMAECARMAALHDDIEQMPMAYQTLVGDMGTVLSGGQKQRLLLARALYKRPHVLILDEATSHLDVESEAQGQRRHRLAEHHPHRRGPPARNHPLGTPRGGAEPGRVQFDGAPARILRAWVCQRCRNDEPNPHALVLRPTLVGLALPTWVGAKPRIRACTSATRSPSALWHSRASAETSAIQRCASWR